MGTEQLTRSSCMPLYLQLAEQIKSQIRQGSLKEGDRLMTEFELSHAYGVSRITVRKAVETLVDEDVLVKRQGVGTFVLSPKISRTVRRCQGFSESCYAIGKQPGAKLIDAELIEPSESDITRLGLTPGEKVIRIYRIRYGDGIPVMLEDNHFSQRYAFLLASSLEGSLLELLRSHNICPTGGTKTIGICHASKKEAEYLDVAPNSALLLVKDKNHDAEGTPIYTTKCIVNPDRYSLTFEV